MPKIIYFTAGDTPTGPETTAINALNAYVPAGYEVVVRNRLASQNFGAGPEACDYVAGTLPAGLPWSGKPVFDPAAPPRPTSLPSTRAVVSNGQKIAGVTGSGTFANIVVSGGVVTGVTLTAS